MNKLLAATGIIGVVLMSTMWAGWALLAGWTGSLAWSEPDTFRQCGFALVAAVTGFFAIRGFFLMLFFWIAVIASLSTSRRRR